MQSELRKRLIEAFTDAGGEFLSGQHLAEIAGCSRTAVWKHIEELRKEGFVFEAVKRKGYKILQTPEKVSADEISLGLKTAFLGRTIHYEESVSSTQKIAHRLVTDGVSDGTVVVAEEQTSGKGRMDRQWHSPKYSGVWMSVILKPNLPPPRAPQLTLVAAVAVVQAIEELTGLMPQIKWPNDILVGGKKVTGILTELQADSDRIKAVIIGIGINVNQQYEDFPEELLHTASSLAIESGKPISRASLIQSVLSRLEKLYITYLQNGFHPIKLLWESYAISIGKNIIARTLTGEIKGKALGITEDGVLMIEQEDGAVRQVYSADILLEND
ncbi:biotin--[acetyl-CoA-carboxylase] ligase [Mesobacillus foraminis]|uniref:Bifunctional ligase/repressor BirA n=1 Tax=Mesobacillus foraminis TaxID=279826 RepID=A0A4R2B8L8_9BACI|nr:biotin--[acetyl-CoA-carboxylase] ligase [Mesobacillus foraminis]TCN23067.1 BirA family biotin operon repressor/biotin-[acetyl-CoA-carboxylase] ligase [Mesobacillus foraminis]